MGGRISFTVGGYSSRIGLRVLGETGKMVSAVPLSDAQSEYFEKLERAALISALAAHREKIEQAKASNEQLPAGLPAYDNCQSLYMPVPDGMLPDRVTIKTGKSVAGFYSDEGIVYVSGRLKAIIEEFDPGKHQFKRLQAEWRDGSLYDADEIYAFKVCQMLNTVDDRHPNFLRSRPDGDALHALTFAGAELFNVNASAVSGAGIWYEQRMKEMFFSDAFMARLRAEKIPGWEVHWGQEKSFHEVWPQTDMPDSRDFG